MRLDSDGQPYGGFHEERREMRDVAEMLGLVSGVLADGIVNESEVIHLHSWVEEHRQAVQEWPGSKIHERLQRIFADGKVDPDEAEDLRDLLTQLVGGDAGLVSGHQAATALPLDHPPPAVELKDRLYCFTGKFAFGPRKACEAVVTSFGGRCSSGVTKDTHFLVVGTFGSRDWIQTSYGTKILKAVEYRERGLPLAILAEEVWVKGLPAA